MTSSTRIRFGALAAAAAVVAGGFFAAAPANAATGTITLNQSSFVEGDWAGGIAVAGTGFTADSEVTLHLANSATGPIEDAQVTADSSGDFSTIFVPTAPPVLLADGETLSIWATSDAGDDSNAV